MLAAAWHHSNAWEQGGWVKCGVCGGCRLLQPSTQELLQPSIKAVCHHCLGFVRKGCSLAVELTSLILYLPTLLMAPSALGTALVPVVLQVRSGTHV